MAIYSSETIVRFDRGDYEIAAKKAHVFSTFREHFGESPAVSAYEVLPKAIFKVGIISAEGRHTGISLELTDSDISPGSSERADSVCGVIYIGEENLEHNLFERVLGNGEDMKLTAHQYLLGRLMPIPGDYSDTVGVGYLSLIGSTERKDLNLLRVKEDAVNNIERVGHSTIADAGRLTVSRFVELISGRPRHAQ